MNKSTAGGGRRRCGNIDDIGLSRLDKDIIPHERDYDSDWEVDEWPD